jgi:mediator of RNA polymerase II transcription subunit 12
MSAIIQAVGLHCPTALVWNHSGEGKISSHLVGSPLDHLPIPPSALPMAPRFSNDHVRTCDLNSRITFFLSL